MDGRHAHWGGYKRIKKRSRTDPSPGGTIVRPTYPSSDLRSVTSFPVRQGVATKKRPNQTGVGHAQGMLFKRDAPIFMTIQSFAEL